LRFVLEYLKPLRLRMAVGFAIKVIGTVAELFLPMILSHILDSVIVTQNVGLIVLYGVLMVLCAAVACVCNMVANRSAAKVAMLFSRKMRRDLFLRTMELSARDTDRFTVPSLEARITSDTYNVQNFVSMMQRVGVRAPIILIGGIAITLIMDAYLSLVMIATIPLIFVIVYFVSRLGVPLYTRVQSSVDGMVRVVREDVQGVRVIKALSKEDYEVRRYEQVNSTLSRDERRAGTIMGAINPAMNLIMNLGITAVVALAANRVAGGESSAPTVIAFMQYFTLISMAVMHLSRMFTTYTKCAASATRISEVIHTPDTQIITEKGEKRDTGAYITFDNVSFSYFGKTNNVEDISFSLKRGERLGIIGATGSGKSTLIRLLMRIYDARGGEITVDGYPVSSYTREELSSLFGVVLQQDFLYSDTVMENIRFGRDITDEDIVRAAKIAQAHDFITAKEGGYEYVLSQKGTNLSGGQRQRLLIARAIAAKPDILILDDASSALDYKTDAALRRALSENLSGSTVITVAQRVSSVKDCDLILVVEDGRIIGRGKHEQLLRDCTEYREISDSQMGGAIVE